MLRRLLLHLLIPLCLCLPAGAAGPEDPRELESWLDGVVEHHRKRLGTPGVVVSVVKDGRVFLQKGWGFAEVETVRPVDPERTVFRVGSISKLMVATLIMQLVEQGRLSLDDEVARHLPELPLEDGPGGPLRVHHLLTHTGGLDERVRGVAARRDRDLLPLGEYLRRDLPPRIRPPGEVFQYSNHGSCLAGRLIEVLTGESFPEAARRRLFEPLGMTSSSFVHVPGWEDRMAHPYATDLATGAPRRLPRYEFQIGPAGGLRATAHDMNRFMLAHLGGGELDGKRILSRESVERMHRRHHGHHPRLPGMALGWFQGPRGLGHAGGSLPYLSTLVILPRWNAGIFFSSNAITGAELFGGVMAGFMERYYPLPEAVPSPRTGGDVSRFAGTYRLVNIPRGSWFRLSLLLPPGPQEMVVEAVGDGRLELATDLGTRRLQLERVEPLAFERKGSAELVAFAEDASGRPDRLFFHRFLPMAYERVELRESRRVQLGLLLLILLALAWYGVLSPLLRVLLGAGPALPDGPLPPLVCLAHLAVLAIPVLALVPMTSWIPAAGFGTPVGVLVLRSLGWMAAAATAALGFGALRAPGRAPAALAALAALAFELHWSLLLP